MVLAQISSSLVRLFREVTPVENRLTAQSLLPHKNLVQLMVEKLEVTLFNRPQLDVKISMVRALQLVV
jgi:hypothetical protein